LQALLDPLQLLLSLFEARDIETGPGKADRPARFVPRDDTAHKPPARRAFLGAGSVLDLELRRLAVDAVLYRLAHASVIFGRRHPCQPGAELRRHLAEPERRLREPTRAKLRAHEIAVTEVIAKDADAG